MQPMEMRNSNIRNSCFTMKFTYFAGAISYYLKDVPLSVHVTVVIFSIYEHEKVDL